MASTGTMKVECSMALSFFVNVIGQLLRQTFTAHDEKSSERGQYDPDDPRPDAQRGFMQAMIEVIEDHFHSAEHDHAAGDEPYESADHALHAATDGLVCASKSAFTDGRNNTTMVNTPSTVPSGINRQATPATIKQNM